MTKRLFVAAVVAAGLLLTGCSSAPPPWRPDQGEWPYTSKIDWGNYRPGLQTDIDAAGEARDCEKIYGLFEEAMDAPPGNEEILTYIDRWGTRDQCARFLDQGEDKVDPAAERELQRAEESDAPHPSQSAKN